MAELNERTKIGLQVGTAIAVLLAVLSIGKWWGGMESERAATAATLARHDQAIAALQDTLGSINATLEGLNAREQARAETINGISRTTQALLYEVTGGGKGKE